MADGVHPLPHQVQAPARPAQTGAGVGGDGEGADLIAGGGRIARQDAAAVGGQGDVALGGAGRDGAAQRQVAAADGDGDAVAGVVGGRGGAVQQQGTGGGDDDLAVMGGGGETTQHRALAVDDDVAGAGDGGVDRVVGGGDLQRRVHAADTGAGCQVDGAVAAAEAGAAALQHAAAAQDGAGGGDGQRLAVAVGDTAQRDVHRRGGGDRQRAARRDVRQVDVGRGRDVDAVLAGRGGKVGGGDLQQGSRAADAAAVGVIAGRDLKRQAAGGDGGAAAGRRDGAVTRCRVDLQIQGARAAEVDGADGDVVVGPQRQVQAGLRQVCQGEGGGGVGPGGREAAGAQLQGAAAGVVAGAVQRQLGQRGVVVEVNVFGVGQRQDGRGHDQDAAGSAADGMAATAVRHQRDAAAGDQVATVDGGDVAVAGRQADGGGAGVDGAHRDAAIAGLQRHAARGQDAAGDQVAVVFADIDAARGAVGGVGGQVQGGSGAVGRGGDGADIADGPLGDQRHRGRVVQRAAEDGAAFVVDGQVVAVQLDGAQRDVTHAVVQHDVAAGGQALQCGGGGETQVHGATLGVRRQGVDLGVDLVAHAGRADGAAVRHQRQGRGGHAGGAVAVALDVAAGGVQRQGAGRAQVDGTHGQGGVAGDGQRQAGGVDDVGQAGTGAAVAHPEGQGGGGDAVGAGVGRGVAGVEVQRVDVGIGIQVDAAAGVHVQQRGGQVQRRGAAADGSAAVPGGQRRLRRGDPVGAVDGQDALVAEQRHQAAGQHARGARVDGADLQAVLGRAAEVDAGAVRHQVEVGVGAVITAREGQRRRG
ncbi:hypothetical protein AZA_84943 [Nitrospirillum viridazoti Y2]|nr:hypothetical protein AZA_84943 [Nitrospirillum amazonense Y2]